MSNLILWIFLAILGLFAIIFILIEIYKSSIKKRFAINSKNWSGKDVAENYLLDDNKDLNINISLRNLKDFKFIKKSTAGLDIKQNNSTYNNKDLYEFVKSCELAYCAKRSQPTFLKLWVVVLAILSFLTFILMAILIVNEYMQKGIFSSILINKPTQLASISIGWVLFIFALAFFLVKYNYRDVEKSIINYAKLHLTRDEIHIVEQICEVRSMLWGLKVIFFNLYYIVLIALKPRKPFYPKVDFENVIKVEAN